MTGTEGSTAVPAAAAGSGATARETVTVPSALSMNAPSQPQRRNPLEDYLQQGKKRRRSAALHEGTLGKGKRRAILAQPTSRDTKVGKRNYKYCSQRRQDGLTAVHAQRRRRKTFHRAFCTTLKTLYLQ